MTNKAFSEALDRGTIQPATWEDGTPLIINQIQYYQATEEGFNLSVNRFHAFGDTLRRHDELKLTNDVLTTALVALTSLGKVIRLHATTDTEQVLNAAQEILLITDRLEQRRALGLSVEQVYEIASIFYFTDDEDPGFVDTSKVRRNISNWLKCDESGRLYAFFLRTPIKNYMPLAGLLDINILSYLKEENVADLLDWTRMLLQLRTSGEKPETMSIIESHRETLFEYDGLLSSVLNPTTISAARGSEPKPEQ